MEFPPLKVYTQEAPQKMCTICAKIHFFIDKKMVVVNNIGSLVVTRCKWNMVAIVHAFSGKKREKEDPLRMKTCVQVLFKVWQKRMH